MEANNDEVICPACVHQFRAIPVNVQAEIAALRSERDALQAKLEAANQLAQLNGEIAASLKHERNAIVAKLVPLTVRQIAEATGDFGEVRSDKTIGIARAIEAAHGIQAKGGQQ